MRFSALVTNIKSCGLASALLLLVACSHSNLRAPSEARFGLDMANRLKLGARAVEVEGLLGKPDLVLSLSEKLSEAWLYCDERPCTQGRITVHLDSATRSVRAVVWNADATDPESRVEVAKARYPAAHFLRKQYLYDYGHYMETIEAMVAPEAGIEFGLNEKGDQVKMIYRRNSESAQSPIQSSRKLPRITELPPSDRVTASDR